MIVDGDVVLDTSGAARMIEGKPKLRQDLAEMLAIEVQSDGMGAGIASVVGQQDFDDGLDTNTEFLIHDRLTSAAQRFIALQRQSMAAMTPAEVVLRVVSIDAARSSTDSRVYRWRIDFQTQDDAYSSVRGKIGA